MIGHGIANHQLLHDRMHNKTIHEDMHHKNIHSNMHFGHITNTSSVFKNSFMNKKKK